MDAMSKDVVGARLNLDMSKITPAFKVIDGGARKNAESFQILNTEIKKTQQLYNELANAANKAKTAGSSLNTAQKVSTSGKIDTSTEKALQYEQRVRRQIAADQEQANKRADREREQALQYEQRVKRQLAAEEQRNASRLAREREQALRYEQRVRTEMARQEQMQAEKMKQVSGGSAVLDRVKNAALHATVYQGLYTALHTAQEALHEGLVGIEANMAGYMQTNEKYFVSFTEGTHEMVINTQRLHEETTKFIHTAHDLGASVDDVTESARLWGRMYKDVGIVQELVRQSTQLSVVDMVSLEDATKGMESVLSQYGVQIKNTNEAMVIGNRVLDSWSKVAHDTMAPAADLAAAFQRTGKIAQETGVSFDFMNGLISAGVRNTALGGANLGNMWKTVLGTIRTDKAVSELERLGVKTTEIVEGMENWRKAEDILLDLSVAVTNKNYDLTQSYADISRGVYQFAKLAASMNAGDILLGTAASIGSSGATLEYLKVQMDTIQRKASQVKTSLLEIFNQAGDDGLRRMIKNVLDVLDRMLIGLTKVPTEVFAVTAALSGAFLAFKALKEPVMTLIAAVGVLTRAKAVDTAATIASTAANEVQIISSNGATLSTVQRTTATTAGAAAQSGMAAATGVATAAMTTQAAVMTVVTGGLVVLGAAFAGIAFAMGQEEKARRDRIQSMKDEESVNQQLVSQYDRQIDLLPKLVNTHNSYQKMLDSGSLSVGQQTKVKKQLDEVSKALVITIGEEGAAQLKAAGYTDEATEQQISKLKDLIVIKNEARQAMLQDQRNEALEQQAKKQEELNKAVQKLTELEAILERNRNGSAEGDWIRRVEKARTKVDELKSANSQLSTTLADTNVAIAELSISQDQLAGSAGKGTESVKDQEEALADLRGEIENNGSAISELNGILKDLAKGQALNAESAADLIIKYPELADKIYKTADGWMFESAAIEEQRQIKIKKAITDLESEKESESATLLATQNRIRAYGVEMQSIRDLATLKAKLNGAAANRDLWNKLSSAPPSASPYGLDLGMFDPAEALKDALAKQMAEEDASLAEIEAFYNEYFAKMGEYDDKIGALGKLYNDPGYGAGGSGKDNSSKSGSGGSSKKEKGPLAEAFAASQAWIEHKKKMGELTTEQELTAWKRIQAQYKVGTEWRIKADEQVYALQQQLEKETYDKSMARLAHKKATSEMSANDELVFMLKLQSRYAKGTELRKQLDEQVYALEKAARRESLSDSEAYLSHKKAMGQLALAAELKAWEKMQARYLKGTEERMKADEQVYALKKALLQESMSKSESYIAHEKAMGRMTLEQELIAWERVQARYAKGTEQRKKADEQVYALRKQLLEREQSDMEKFVANQKPLLEKLKNEALERIKAERDAYVEAQDAKIKALDDLLAKENESNEDEDYEKALAEKQARLALLQSAVGPEGIAERKQVEKDIQQMQVERERVLYKRDIEAQKKKLEEEKAIKLKDYDQQIKEAEDHFEELLAAFDDFSSDAAGMAERLKQLQILREKEKNAEILAQLDLFIAEYQAKMKAIETAGMTQEEKDLLEYNANKDAYDAAKKSGDTAEMARLTARNQEIRTQYGVAKDTGKLQHFSEGGVVLGQTGAAVPVVAHAGEMYLNSSQQGNLFKLLDMQMPSFNFSMPAPSGSSQTIINNYQYSVSTGDVYNEDSAAARTFWDGKDNLISKFQSREGAKQR
ncbi:hypothetical protein BBD42_30860 [Paenibacillus sp. BIHB 4019]|uniref:Phage tail tape measure protein domain-containing protein n=1 Tax=Paenibacillus sp. BIHB 4019 TaxID=1870819 RepID=A0A1B2DRS6_9BACL|nr:phage tail tape measure protein [Paenibacillus sp. BIHB 4019]ANY70408.1 hypothetical protein BBD42_30860 [Paenibacillus sp. BIHB 4019]